jgi:hypothetical protein
MARTLVTQSFPDIDGFEVPLLGIQDDSTPSFQPVRVPNPLAPVRVAKTPTVTSGGGGYDNWTCIGGLMQFDNCGLVDGAGGWLTRLSVYSSEARTNYEAIDVYGFTQNWAGAPVNGGSLSVITAGATALSNVFFKASVSTWENRGASAFCNIALSEEYVCEDASAKQSLWLLAIAQPVGNNIVLGSTTALTFTLSLDR